MFFVLVPSDQEAGRIFVSLFFLHFSLLLGFGFHRTFKKVFLLSVVVRPFGSFAI